MLKYKSMSKDRIGFVNDKDAEKCRTAVNGGPCPLFSERPYATCSVRAMIDQIRHSKTARQDAINAYSRQIPINCPANYK